MYVCMCRYLLKRETAICVCVCMYVCMYVCVYIYIFQQNYYEYCYIHYCHGKYKYRYVLNTVSMRSFDHSTVSMRPSDYGHMYIHVTYKTLCVRVLELERERE